MQQRFLLQILLLAQHVSGTTMPIVTSSRVLYGGCCLWYFVLWFSSCWSDVELRVMCPVCRMLQHPANRTHNPYAEGRCLRIGFKRDEVTGEWRTLHNEKLHDLCTCTDHVPVHLTNNRTKIVDYNQYCICIRVSLSAFTTLQELLEI